MSSSLVNYASRVLGVDQESSSFVPIVGLNTRTHTHTRVTRYLVG